MVLVQAILELFHPPELRLAVKKVLLRDHSLDLLRLGFGLALGLGNHSLDLLHFDVVVGLCLAQRVAHLVVLNLQVLDLEVESLVVGLELGDFVRFATVFHGLGVVQLGLGFVGFATVFHGLVVVR